MKLDHTHLKVDQTVLSQQQIFILVSNVNIPVDQFTHLDNILNRVIAFVSEDYKDLEHPLYFQVCATYELRNTQTGEIKLWTGSFNPKGNTHNVLAAFQIYNRSTFAQHTIEACTQTNIYNRLRLFHSTTTWVFHQITSAIISFQAIVKPNHPTLINRNLLNIRQHGYRQRVCCTFHLP